MTTIEELAQDLGERLTAIGEQVSEQRILDLIKTSLPSLIEDETFVRKMRFGAPTEPGLVGSKFARHGYSQADVEFLYDLMNSHRGQPRRNGGTHPGPSEELEKSFKGVSDAYYLSEDEARQVDRQALDDLFPRIPRAWLQGKTRAEAKADAIRAATMDTTQSGFGQQLVGAQYVGDLWDAAFQESRIAGLIETFEMTAPTAYLPVAVDMPEMMYVSESTSDVIATAQYPTVRTGSQRVQVDAKKFLFHQVWSGEMEEDSIIPYIPFLRRQLARALAFYSDSLFLNGDTTNAATGNINLDDADPADTKWYLAFDGIRHAPLVDNTANSKDVAGAVSLNTLRDLKELMRDETRFVDWGNPNDPNSLVYICDPSTAQRIALLDEVLQAKFMLGSRADLLSGQVATIIGHPVISTMAQPKTEADGKVSTTAANNTLGQITVFNREGFTTGWRRRIRIETERIPGSDQSRLVASLRLGFGRFTPTGNVNAIEAAAVGYNISLA